MLFGAIIAVAIICLFTLVYSLIHAHSFSEDSLKSEVLREKILDCLPGKNCGACGFGDCASMAYEMAEGRESFSACPVGGVVTAQAVSVIMGREQRYDSKVIAHVKCSGTCRDAKRKYVYDSDSGIDDCLAVMKLGGGDKSCKYGCVGMGTCLSICPFDAIEICDGLAVVNKKKCTGCGICVSSCPKHLIELIPIDKPYFWINCMSRDNADRSKQNCGVGCTGCGECIKVCKYDAVILKAHLATIDNQKCADCGLCAKVCPERIIKFNGISGVGNVEFNTGTRRFGKI